MPRALRPCALTRPSFSASTFGLSSLVSLLLLGCTAPAAPERPLDDVFFIVSGPDAVAFLGDSVHLQVAIKDPVPRPVTDDVVWTTADPDVATVSARGVVKMRHAGSTVVTATYLNYTAKTTVHASSSATKNGPSITVEPAQASLVVGKSIDVKATVRGPKGAEVQGASVDWASNDTAVATVTDGRVTGVAPGAAVVTASARGRSSSVSITVQDPDAGGGGGGDPDAVDRFRAFPEAEGYGAEALMRCDRTDVQVMRVTSTESSGPGTFRDALDRVDLNRLTVIVFTQGGTYTLSEWDILKGCLYIAGQTAPGEGVQVYNPYGANALLVDRSGEASDLVIRYMRYRSSKGTPGDQDVISIRGGHDIILDHVSSQFGNDEVLSLEPVAINGTNLFNVTVSHSMIAVGLKPHSTGSLIVSPKSNLTIKTSKVSLHHNLWAHNAHRNPWLSDVTEVEIVNNVMYNWRGNVGRLRQRSSANIVGNTFKAGPWSASQGREGTIFVHDTLGALSTAHIVRNVAQPFQPSPTGDQKVFLRYEGGGAVVPNEVFSSTSLAAPRFAIDEQTASASYSDVVEGVGASRQLTCDGRWRGIRDVLDARIVDHVTNHTGPGSDAEMDDPSDFGGVPSLSRGTPCPDEDSDGMPDAFEDRFGLDRQDPSDVSGDPDGDGYVNIEEYVNGTVPR